MQVQSMFFKKRAAEKLGDELLQANMRKAKGKFVDGRAKAVAEFGVWEEVRAHAAKVRDRALANLDAYLVEFEANATRRGAVVHWAETAEEACAIVAGIARDNGVRKAAKSKSMVSEEVNLNEALEAAGVEVIETDLGEYILQLAHEPPSHIVAPAVHKSKEQVAELFVKAHGKPRLAEIPAMTREAREALRGHFLSADMGISGSNFVIAETGTTLTVTNEGNADMVTTLPRIHVVITGIEKVIGTLEDFATLIRLLPRSAIGQTVTNYLTLTTGLKMPDEADGPEQMHIVLVDAGRTKLLGGPMQEMLRCIRCGACMNHCPVYHSVGGHAYGWVYPGPMGSVLTPGLVGVDKAGHLPNASTFCGRCESVCPMRIPLPKMMRHWREREFERHLNPAVARWGLGLWAFFARRPWLYRMATGMAASLLGAFGRREGRFASLPLAGGWTKHRDFPAPEGKTFHQLWREKRAH